MKKKTQSKLKKEAWVEFSRMIRLRDADKDGYCRCITCGKRSYWEKEGMQAGHAIEGRKNYIIFDEEVVFAQCDTCNIWGSGKYGEYASILIGEHGKEWYDEKHKYKVKQFTDKELVELKESFKSRAEEYKNKICNISL